MILRTSETGVTALSSKCTHLGCEVPLPENGLIECPCHHANFDMTGKVTRGPAKLPLHSYSAVLNGSILTITDTAG